jgi:hypothetical protein
MSEHTISLPESIYQSLLKAAQAKGLSPANWIAAQLAPVTEQKQPPTDFPEDLFGIIDSKAEPIHRASIDEDDAFGQGVVAKLAKQGIHLP